MNEFTPAYLRQTILEFRDQLGRKDFWQNDEKHSAAVKALSHVYFNYDQTDLTEREIESLASSYESALLEYTKRESMIFLHNLWKK